MTWEDHLFQTASAGSPSYSAREFRAMFAELWDEGILEGLSITQRGAGANMSVDCNIGGGIITGDDQARQGNYVIRCTALENKTVTAAPGSNTRLDRVVAEVLDPDSGGAAGRITQFRVIAGTPAPSPALPALPPSAISLAQLGPITTSTTSITTGLITDLRGWAGQRCEPGTIRMRAGQRLPSGWLECDGTVKVRATYPRLFDMIGTLYNIGGEAGTDFRLPNFTGRIPWPQYAGEATIDTVGEAGGAYTHTLAASELAHHVHSMQNHSHVAGSLSAAAGSPGGSAAVASGVGANAAQSVSQHGHTITGSTGVPSTPDTGGISGTAGGGAHQNMPPFTVVPVFIIRT